MTNVFINFLQYILVNIRLVENNIALAHNIICDFLYLNHGNLFFFVQSDLANG